MTTREAQAALRGRCSHEDAVMWNESNRVVQCHRCGEQFVPASVVRAALDELGVPGPGYPAPIANAVEILEAGPEWAAVRAQGEEG